jgi:hypothetical protein
MSKCQDCDKDAGYGYKGGKRLYCCNDKKDGMINLKGYICSTEPCIRRAAYAYSKDDDKLYCGQCKDINMINVLNPMCIVCHEKQPRYNYDGEKKGKYCKEDKLEGMVDVITKKCKKCKKIIACYGFLGGEKEYCVTHKLEGMKDLSKRECLECDITPIFNYEGEKQGIYCSVHKKEGMIDVFNPKCKFPCCKHNASFSSDGKHKEYCSQHKDDDMEIIGRLKCQVCGITPIYGFEGGPKTHCSKDKLEGQIDLAHRKCEKCKKNNAIYNFKGQKIGKYCHEHAEKGMIDITAIYCDDCIDRDVRASFGFPGNTITKCRQHKKPGMISNPNKKCTSKPCNKIAIYGISKQQHCEKHKEKGEYNLIEKECKLCKLLMILNEEGLCGFCDPTMIKNFRLAKQKEIKTLLDNKGYKYMIYDRIIDTQCGYERPDFVFDCQGFFVVLEVDENADKSYHFKSSECERNRMININQALGAKTIFIRYNPDTFKTNNVKHTITKNKRQDLLLKVLDKMLKQDYNEIEFLSVVYLFYNDFDTKNIILEDINIFKKD